MQIFHLARKYGRFHLFVPTFPPIHAYLSDKKMGGTEAKMPIFLGKGRHEFLGRTDILRKIGDISLKIILFLVRNDLMLL